MDMVANYMKEEANTRVNGKLIKDTEKGDSCGQDSQGPIMMENGQMIYQTEKAYITMASVKLKFYARMVTA